MHEVDFDISIKDLSKIEGHTDCEIEVRNGKVTNSKLIISENKRFFTTAVIGKPAIMVHQIVSRICGTCSIAHLLCAIKAVEDAGKIEVSEQTKDLRDLLYYGLNIRDHAMHLYLFCLPDLFEKDSVLDFEDTGLEHELIHNAFEIKSVGNDLSNLVGGRAVHSPYPLVGGFMKIPKKEELKKMEQRLKEIRSLALEFVEIFDEKDSNFETDAEFISLRNSNFSYLEGELYSSDGICIPKNQFTNHLEKKVIPYSQAPGFKFKGRPYVVGALSRLNLNRDTLHKETKKSTKKYLLKFPSKNIFHNNLAQAIEIIHCIDASVEIIQKYEERQEEKKTYKIGKSEGIGVIEAPRGTLYYHLKIDENGKIENADLVIPTSQNQINMDKDIGKLVQKKLDQNMDQEKIRFEIERLIRAYDPCMSCATHFLKVKWK
jgi:coenzyme F420-reducing hydrogenase alpha subunit